MPFLLGSEEHTSELQSPCNLVCRFWLDRKSTRLNSSHLVISYAVFCLKKKNYIDSNSKRSLLLYRFPQAVTSGVTAYPEVTECTWRVRDVPFFFNDTATTEIYTLSLHDALPI